MNPHADLARSVASQLRERISENNSIDEPLDALLAATNARATGLWRRKGNELRLVGFRAVPDMPREVSEGFAAATERVSLEQTGLGIVKAAVDAAPAVALLEGHGGLGASASWLARFEAKSSLAVPIRTGEDVSGVLAISTADVIAPEQPAWAVIEAVAEGLEGSF